MQIVIDIGEHNKNVIDRFVNGEGFEVLPTPIVDDVIRAVRNGKLLPKGHGRLIDADALPLNDIDNANYGSNYIRIAQTIVEADRAD